MMQPIPGHRHQGMSRLAPRHRGKPIWVWGALSVLLSLAGAGPAHAADEAQVLRLRAEQLAARGQCAEALPIVREARRLDPLDALAALVEGECALRVGQSARAIQPLREARRLDPSLSAAILYLGIAHYELGQLEAAERELNQAEQLLPESAEVFLYRGLVLLRGADAVEAATSFERAAALSPDTVEPVASYYAGRAWQIAADRTRAEQALRRVIERAPGSPWAQQAEQALSDHLGRSKRRGLRGGITTGLEWDSNVLLRGQGSVIASGGEGDGRGFWSLDGGSELFRNLDWTLGVGASYYGNAHFDLKDFNLQVPIGYAWVDRAIGETSFARLQFESGFAWLGTDPYLFPITVTLSGHHRWADAGSGHAYFRYGRRDYRFPIDKKAPPQTPSPLIANVKKARDRDGSWYQGGYDHVLPLKGTLLRAGVNVGRYDSHREYTHTAITIAAGGHRELIWDLGLDVDLSYTAERYDNPSTFAIAPTPPSHPTSDRRDDIWKLQIELERDIAAWLKMTARYQFTDDDSNTPTFDYDRHIVGLYFTVSLGEK